MDLETIEQELLNLPLTERAKLAHELLDSQTPNQLDEAWLAEVERRASELDAGLATCIPAEEVMRKARALLK
jgi:putative addiction module component (TIGR02574 family)